MADTEEKIEDAEDIKELSLTDKLEGGRNFRMFITSYENGELQLTSKIKYKIRDVIEENERMFHGKFTNPKDGNFTKIFYNIGYIIFRTIYQNTDIDTKDIQMRSTNGQGIQVIALLRLAIQSYLHRIKFGTFLNDLRYFIKDGTTHVKIVDGKPSIVSPLNIIEPATGGSVQETGIGEKVLMSWEEMQSHKSEWADSWDRIEELHEQMLLTQTHDFITYEFWNEHKFVVNGKIEIHKGCIRFLDLMLIRPTDRLQTKNPNTWQPYHELERFITPHKKKRTSKRMRKELGEFEELYPYKELHFIKVPGRKRGFSCFELIAGIQESYNRQMNLHEKKDILDLMGVFVHKKNNTSPSIGQSLLNNIEAGTVAELEIDEDLQRLVIDTKSNELINNVDKLLEVAFQIVGVTAQGAGQDMPAETKVGVAAVNQRVQQTTYDYAIEQMSLFLTELFDDFFLETIFDELSDQDWIEIIGDSEELKEIDKFFVTELVKQESFNRYKKLEKLQGDVSWDQIAILEDLERAEIEDILRKHGQNPDQRFAQLEKEFIKKLNFSFEFYVNNEGFDKQTKIENLQSMRQDTQLSSKKIDMTILDLMGENPKAFEKTPDEIKAEQQATAPPTKAPSESINYKDAPPDIQRQMEKAAGFQPSQVGAQPVNQGAGAPSQPIANQPEMANA